MEIIIRKNTERLRKLLEKIGITDWSKGNDILEGITDTEESPWLGVYKNEKDEKRYFGTCLGETDKGEIISDNAINCGINEILFLNLALYDSATDFAQWFVYQYDEDFWFRCPEKNINDYVAYMASNEKLMGNPKKATVEDIIEHFKNKI